MGGCITSEAHYRQNQHLRQSTNSIPHGQNYRQSPNNSSMMNQPRVITHPTPVFINETPTPQIFQVPAYQSILPSEALQSFVHFSDMPVPNNQRPNSVLNGPITIRPISPVAQNTHIPQYITRTPGLAQHIPMGSTEFPAFKSNQMGGLMNPQQGQQGFIARDPIIAHLPIHQRPISPIPSLQNPVYTPANIPISRPQSPYSIHTAIRNPSPNNIQYRPMSPSNRPLSPIRGQTGVMNSLLNMNQSISSHIQSPELYNFRYGMKMSIMGE